MERIVRCNRSDISVNSTGGKRHNHSGNGICDADHLPLISASKTLKSMSRSAGKVNRGPSQLRDTGTVHDVRRIRDKNHESEIWNLKSETWNLNQWNRRKGLRRGNSRSQDSRLDGDHFVGRPLYREYRNGTEGNTTCQFVFVVHINTYGQIRV